MALLALDDTAEATAVEALGKEPWDVVVIGGGIRKPEPLLEFFEQGLGNVWAAPMRSPRELSSCRFARGSWRPSGSDLHSHS
jgi:hypothetical protein